MTCTARRKKRIKRKLWSLRFYRFLRKKERTLFPVFTSVSNTGSVITAVTIATPVSLRVQQQCFCMYVQMAANRGTHTERETEK